MSAEFNRTNITDIKDLIPTSETVLLCKVNKYDQIVCGLYNNYKLIRGHNILPVNFETDYTRLLPTKQWYPNLYQRFLIHKAYSRNIKY